jgi:hypothetical protein
MREIFGFALLGASIAVVVPAHAQHVGADAPARASELADPVACGSGRVGPIWEFGAQGASNSVGLYDQEIYAAVGTASICLNDKARLRFEGLAASFDDGIGTSHSYVAGVGVSFQAAPGWTLTPAAYIGFEDLYNGNDQEVATVALTAQYTHTVERESGDTYLLFEARPEYVGRQSASSSTLGTGREATFVNYVGIGFDRPLAPGFRGRVKLGHRYIDADQPITSIFMATTSLGGENVYGGYRWIADLTYSSGNGDYEGVLFGLTLRHVSD